MDLHTYLSLFSTTAIVLAGIFAGVQLRQLYKQRSRELALQLLRSFQTPEFTDAVNEEMRAIGNRDTYYEWVQWLAEQFEKRESKIPVVPSYIAHRDWKE